MLVVVPLFASVFMISYASISVRSRSMNYFIYMIHFGEKGEGRVMQ